jgi:fimbrial chaperone protein
MPNYLPRLAVKALCALCAAVPAFAAAGEFSVNPIRLEMGASARSGSMTVKNEGSVPLRFQLQAMEWTQDAEGKDQYLETRDLIFFPKLMTVEPGQDAVVRVGVRNPVVPAEKTFRLFIEELPSANPPAGKGPQVNVVIRFGAPIFVAPIKSQDGLELEGLAVERGEIKLSARNTGNRHQMVQGIQLRGTDAAGAQVYTLTLADRYLLAGTTKSYTAAISPEQCRRIAALEVELKTDKLSAQRKLSVDPAACAQ